MNVQSVNQFEILWNLGYRRLVPIIPPGATISEKSNLFKRIAAGKDDRGKTPGIKWPDDTWSGFDFVNHESSGSDVSRWNAMGAGVGIKTGNGLVLIDADTLNPAWAEIIRTTVEGRLGLLPTRFGQRPKAGYLVRTDLDFQYTRIEFGLRDEKGRLKDRVEILSEGRQFVAVGVHPVTMCPYDWPDGVPARDSVPFVPGHDLIALLDTLRPLLPAASDIVREGADTVVDQTALRGDIELVRRAVAATPNTSATFPTRESYVKYGYAIKAAAGPEHEAEALELYQDWCARWDDGDNPSEIVEAEWGRMKAGQFRVGASWLYELATAAGAGIDFTAATWFSAEAAARASDGPLFGDDPADAKPATRKLFDVLNINALFNRPDPKFLIDRHIPEAGVGFLYGDPGTGKSFIALDWALHLAFDRPDWYGDAIHRKEKGCVIYMAGEGASGFKTRVAAWMQHHGITDADSGRFGLIPASVNLMSADDVAALCATLQQSVRSPVAGVVVDTVSRSMPGADENTQKEMTMFVKACDVIRDKFNCMVLGVHHASKQGTMRGSTVLTGAGDFVFKLERKKGASVGYLQCEKQKDAPDGWQEAYRFNHVTVGIGKTSLVPVRCDKADADAVTPEVERTILEAMAAAWFAGEPWSKSAVAGPRMAVRKMVHDFQMDGADAATLLKLWVDTKTIVEDVVDLRAKKKGFRVVDMEADDTDGAGSADGEGVELGAFD